MRGRSSSAKSRLRSAGYKCNLCGRRLIDAATLERHQKTIHNVTPRDNKLSFKTRPSIQRSKLTNKEKDKIFDQLLKSEINSEPKPKSRNTKITYENVQQTVLEVSDVGKTINNKEIDYVKNGESLAIENDKKTKKNESKDSRRVEFECPVCAKPFGAYFTALKHIQKYHSINAEGKKVPLNSPDLIQPIRVEECVKCNTKMRSNEQHLCINIIEEDIGLATDFVCSGCNQIFVSLKTFDMHVAGLHSDAVDSMFFPTRIEFMNWRLEMERQTNAKYTLYGEYESKKIYRCNYARKEFKEKAIAYFCPSSMVVQEFSKGIQVHFYNKHYDHIANLYMLSGKYKKYSITSFLQNPNEDSAVASAAYCMNLDDKDLHSQFKKLMDSLVLNAADVDVSILKVLIEKALEMSAIVSEAPVNENVVVVKPPKNMTDKEITDALEVKTLLHKRRKSVDSCEHPKPAKRTRNKSLFNQSDVSMSPKILNTFSLASNSNSDEFKSDIVDNFVSTVDTTNDEIATIPNKNDEEIDTKSNSSTKINTRLRSSNDSLSFNDSYKDFIDRNFIGKGDNNTGTKSTKNTVKTKLGAFKQTSPRKIENKDIALDITANSKNLGGIKPITLIDDKVEDTSTSKVNMINVETPKVNILNVENPNVTYAKGSVIKMEPLKARNSQSDAPKLDTPKMNAAKINSRAVLSQSIDPVKVNVTIKCDTSSEEPIRMNNSKVSTSTSIPLMDPLELNISTVKSKISVESHARNISKVNTRNISAPLLDPLNVNTHKVDLVKIEHNKLNTPKLEPKVYPRKLNTPKSYPGEKVHKINNPIAKRTPKVTFEDNLDSKVIFENKAGSANNRPVKTKPQKIKELKYEVREQENDCNILVLKF